MVTRRSPKVRWRHAVAGVAVCAVASAMGFVYQQDRARDVRVPLYSQTVGLTASGARQLIPADARPRWISGTRVLRPASTATAARSPAERAADEALSWLAQGEVPGRGGQFEDMARDALLDIRTLTVPAGATVAGWSPQWRYVWPRDVAFVAVALARTGHPDDALHNLLFVQTVQSPDGSLHARYMADGAGPPDDRGLQEDGPGWVLWAAFELLDSLESAEDRRAVLERLDALIDRSTDRILARLDPATGLPAPSSDYWEAPEERLTLGIAASALAGLEAAERLHEASGDASRERRSAAASARLRIALHRAFASHAYPRYVQGADPDAAIAFLLPPFQPTALPGSELALGRAIPRMRRPAGGIAPGVGWKNDGISGSTT